MAAQAALADHVMYQKFLETKARFKMPLPRGAFLGLQRWLSLDNATADDIPHLTFSHIVAYFEADTSVDPNLLKVACADHGYTLDELARLKREGKTARQLAESIIARGVEPDSDDE